MAFESPYFELLKNLINLRDVPFTERGSRLWSSWKTITCVSAWPNAG